MQDTEAQLNTVTSEKQSFQLSAEHAENKLTEQEKLTESLQLVICSFFYSCPHFTLLYMHPNVVA